MGHTSFRANEPLPGKREPPSRKTGTTDQKVHCTPARCHVSSARGILEGSQRQSTTCCGLCAHRRNVPLIESGDFIGAAGGSQGPRGYIENMAIAPAPALPFLSQPSVRAPRSKQSELGQFFTPSPIADFMAAMFTKPTGSIRLLDAGAGEGSLSAAFVARWRDDQPVELDAFEMDDGVIDRLRTKLGALAKEGARANLHHCDFLEVAAKQVRSSAPGTYTHAIMNPPYRKIATQSRERSLVSSAGLETVNLYTAFVGLALGLMEEGGEMVAIIPRSFCNGPYYRPFRDWVLQRAAIRRIHLFHSRRDAFADADVLQENVIVHLVRGQEQGEVLITTSSGATFHDLEERSWPFAAIVRADDPSQVIHIPTAVHDYEKGRFSSTLASLGLDVATGPVVGFRLRQHLHERLGPGDVPLIYPQHLKRGGIVWPIESKKPNAIQLNAETKKWMFPRGWYVLVKRFSSKEERRRVVAALCDPSGLPGLAFGLENKLNVVHANRGSLDEAVARGTTIYLNSTAVDQAFRLFSGHTQVNATDLRRMEFPSLEQLRALGARWCGGDLPDQEAIDDLVDRVGRDLGVK